MILSLVVATSLTVLLGAYSLTVYQRNQIAMNYVNKIKAEYLASAGIQFMRYSYGSDNTWMRYYAPSVVDVQLSFTDDEDEILVRREVLKDTVRITSIANYLGVTRTLTAEEDNDPMLEKLMTQYSRYSWGSSGDDDLPMIRWR